MIRPPSRPGEDQTRLSPFGRFKMVVVGLVLTTILIALLVAALILGYIIAAVACTVLVISIAILLLKAAFQRASR